MKEQIEGVKGEIIDAASALIEYQKALRQLEWDLFDLGQTRFEQLQSEADFLVELLSKHNLFNKDTAEMTDEGKTVKGLYVQNYEVLKNAVAGYRDEIAKLKEELEEDPGNIELINRIKELEEAQRSSILAMEEQKEKIKELYQEEFDTLLSLLDKLIQKYKDALQQQKDLYDYQKNIANQNQNINSIKKQLLAYSESGLGEGSDTTEENRARVQKLNQQLKEAEDQLRETEFDRYIQETGDLLDGFRNDLEEYLNEKLEHLDELFEQAMLETNLNAETIKQTIEDTATNHDYVLTEEFAKIWENMVASDSLFSTMANIDAATSEVCTEIKAGVDLLPTMDGLSAFLDGETLAIVSEIASVDNAVNNVYSAIGETNTALGQIQSRIQEYNASVLQAMASAQAAAERAQQAAEAAQRTADEAKNQASQGSNTSPSSGGDSGGGNGGDYRNYFLKGTVTTQAGRVDRIEINDLTQQRAQELLEKYQRMYPKTSLYVGHYAKGGLVGKKQENPLDLIAQQLGEDHMVAAKEGERILTAKQNENFEKLANTFSSLSSEDMAKYSIFTGNKMIGKMPTLQMPTLRDMNAGNSTEINGGISINLPNVTNKAEFVEWLKTDGQIEKIVQSMTLGKLQGRNSYDKMKY